MSNKDEKKKERIAKELVKMVNQGLLKVVGEDDNGEPIYYPTDRGRRMGKVLVNRLKSLA